MTTHGMKRKSGAAPEYTAWNNIRARCRNPKNKAFKYYGGRGIKVKFKNFEDFFSHVGPKPLGTSIDRIDNNGHYERGNVRWATKDQQMSNRSDNRLITHKGKTQCLSDWSKEIGIPLTTLWARIEGSKWTIAKALETPLLTMKQVSKLGHAAKLK